MDGLEVLRIKNKRAKGEIVLSRICKWYREGEGCKHEAECMYLHTSLNSQRGIHNRHTDRDQGQFQSRSSGSSGSTLRDWWQTGKTVDLRGRGR